MNDESRFISLMSDYGFKVTFADESDTLFLKKVLQALIQSDVPIKKVQFLRNEFVGLTEVARGGLYDMACEDERGRTFIVEMQLGAYKYFIQRTKFYAFQKFNTLVKKGEYYFNDLTPIYCVGFVAKSIFPNSKEYYHYGTLKNQKGEEMDDQITHVIVEISKFDKQLHELQSDLDKIIYIMKNSEALQILEQLPKVLNEDWIAQAMQKLDNSQMTPEQRENFEVMLARNASIIYMEKEEKERMRKEVKEEVREKVEVEVREKVEVEVREKVEVEVREKVEVEVREKVEVEMAKKLKELGSEIHIIIEATGLSEEEIKAL